MKEVLLYVVLPIFLLTAFIAVWVEWLHCKVFGCERPRGKYCGRCGKPQSSGGAEHG